MVDPDEQQPSAAAAAAAEAEIEITDSAEAAEIIDSAVEAAAGPETDAEAEKKKRSKKKKKKSKSKKLQSETMSFPVESFFPWKISKVKNRGRAAVATRAIKPGEVVIAERTIAFVAREQYRKAICHICGIDIPVSGQKTECSLCMYTIFCEACVKPPQESHAQLCPVYKEIEEIAKSENCDADLLRLVFNLALNKTESKKGSEKKSLETFFKDGVIHSSFQDAMTLQTHREKAPANWMTAVHHGCTKLHKIACTGDEQDGTPAPVSCTIEDLEILATLVNTNAHGMGAQGVHNTDVALGIFPFVSILNHSCRPNCCFASDGPVMYVRAIQEIPVGTELCLSYINLYEPRSVRKRQLAETKHFDCTCDRCVEPMKTSVDRFLEGCVCHVKGCGGVLIRTSALHEDQPESVTWECDLCLRVLDPLAAKTKSLNEKPWLLIDSAEKQLVSAVRVYSQRRFKDARKLMEAYLSDVSGKLHQLNVLCFDALTPLMNCCRAVGDAEEGLRVCRLILQSMEKVLPGPSLELSNFYFCLGEMYLEKAQSFSPSSVIAKRSAKQAQEAFQRVKNIRDICLGKPSLPA